MTLGRFMIYTKNNNNEYASNSKQRSKAKYKV